MDYTSNSRPSGTAQRVRIVEDDDRSRSEKSSVEVSGRELVEDSRATRDEDPVAFLKRRLSEWGESSAHNSQPYEEGEEYEMLLDPNLPDDHDRKFSELDLDDPMRDDESNLKELNEMEDSPYPEVRAAVRNYDEDMPCNTVRAWTIGLFLVVIGASMNTLFSLRSPSIGLGALIAQIIAWPLGQGWAKVMPTRQFTLWPLGIRWSLNPGPFNIKEHSIIVVMASVSFSVAYATDIILAQVVFYKQDFGIPWQLLLTISTQSLGYGIAGMMRKFLGRSTSICIRGHG